MGAKRGPCTPAVRHKLLASETLAKRHFSHCLFCQPKLTCLSVVCLPFCFDFHHRCYIPTTHVPITSTCCSTAYFIGLTLLFENAFRFVLSEICHHFVLCCILCSRIKCFFSLVCDLSDNTNSLCYIIFFFCLSAYVREKALSPSVATMETRLSSMTTVTTKERLSPSVIQQYLVQYTAYVFVDVSTNIVLLETVRPRLYF